MATPPFILLIESTSGIYPIWGSCITIHKECMYISKYCRFVGTGPILYVKNFVTLLLDLEEDDGAPPIRIYILISGFKQCIESAYYI